MDACLFDFLTILRWAALLLALPIMVWSAAGFLRFARAPSVVNGFRALAFLIAATSVSFQSGYMLEGLPRPEPHVRTVLSLVLLLACLTVAAGGLWIFRGIKVRGLTDLYDAIDATGPVAELYRMDPEAARELGAEARRRSARRILEE